MANIPHVQKTILGPLMLAIGDPSYIGAMNAEAQTEVAVDNNSFDPPSGP